MESLIREEEYEYGGHIFDIRVLNRDEALYVFAADRRSGKIVDTAKITHIDYSKYCDKYPLRDPAEEIVSVLKVSVSLWVDKDLI